MSVVGLGKRAAGVAMRLVALFLVAVVIGGCGVSGQGGQGAQTRVGAFALAGQAGTGAELAQSPCTHPGSEAARPEIAARFCVAAEGGGSVLRRIAGRLGDETGTVGRRFRTTTNFGEVTRRLERYHGIDPKLAGDRLHEIKAAAGRGAADNVTFDLTGNVYDPRTMDWLGSLTAGGARR